MWTVKGQEFLNRLKTHGRETGINHAKMELPSYCDENKIRSAQRMFRRNYFAIMFAMYLGFIATLAIPSILKVLIHTRRSSSSLSAYKRYMQTIFHTLAWFRNDIRSGSKAWSSLEAVRNMHFRANATSSASSVGIISQTDLTVTQFSYFGFTVVFQKELGIQCNSRELEDFCHFWRVLGHLHGINEDFNICCDNLDETMERLQIVKREFLLPELTNTSEDFVEISKYAVSALQCFDWIDFYEPVLFMLKRLVGVPDYYYFASEIPEGYDKKHLKYLELSYLDRSNLFMSVVLRQYLLNFWIIRWLYNITSYIVEFFVRYIPVIAMIKFGPRNAYVKI